MLTSARFFVDCAPPYLPKGGRERQKVELAVTAIWFFNLLGTDLFTTHGLKDTELVLWELGNNFQRY